MASNKYVICPECKKEIELRWGNFGYEALYKHKKNEHRGGK